MTRRDPRPRLPEPAVAGWYSLIEVTPRTILTARTFAALLGSIHAKVERSPHPRFDAVLWTERRPSGDVYAAWAKVGVNVYDVGTAREDILKMAHAILDSALLRPAGGRTP